MTSRAASIRQDYSQHQSALQAFKTLTEAKLSSVLAGLSYLTVWNGPDMVGGQACPQNSVLLAGVGHTDHLHIRSHAAVEGGRQQQVIVCRKSETAATDAVRICDWLHWCQVAATA